MRILSVFTSKWFTRLVALLFGLALVLIIFQAGVAVGYHKASHSFAWGDNYHKAFGGPEGGVLRDIAGTDYINGYGVSGSVVRLDGKNIVIKERDSVERLVLVDENTSLRLGSTSIEAADLRPNTRVVVIGNPTDTGSILAQLIRVLDSHLPPPPFGLPFGH